MKAWIITALLAAIAFSGCTGDDAGTQEADGDLGAPSPESSVGGDETPTQDDPVNDEPADDEPAGEDDADDGPSTATGNRAPVAVLTPDVTSGEAPLNVTFTVDMSDEDEDFLTFTLDFGDDSDVIEGQTTGSISHIYTSGGDFIANLTVFDGELETSATVTITSIVPETEPVPVYEDLWVIQWDDMVCHAKEAVGEVVYAHDRPGDGEPYGSGFVTGGGTWIYEESNGIEGLQISGAEGGNYASCVDGDTLIF